MDVLLCSADEMRRLNRDYRGLDEATDVLSFPGPAWEGAPLGEIAVSADHVRSGAASRQIPEEHEATFLAAHGALHLCGFDDADDESRAEMVRLANEALAPLGVGPEPGWESAPYAGAH